MRGASTVARLLALLLAALAVVAAGASAVLDLIPGRPGAAAADVAPAAVVPAALFLWGTPILGLVLAIRRPTNPAGWLFLCMTLGWSVSFASDNLARHLPPTPALAGAVVIAQAIGALGFVSLFALLITFPAGSLPSPRWRIVPLVLVVAALALELSSLLAPGSPVDPPVAGLVNPFARPEWTPAVDAVASVGAALMLVVVAGSLALLAVRFRRATGIERQQLKWFASAGMSVAGLFLASSVAAVVLPGTPLSDALWFLPVSALVLLPLAATVAILRYRLYEIDRIISRTLSYAVLTGLLAVLFAGLVVGLEQVLAPLTHSNGLAVAASTLVVFGLFAPLRKRVQGIVDRRFNRARYDADRVVAGFAGRLRGEVELEALVVGIDEVARRTVDPASAAVWLRAGRG